jgi:hypothetical protein
MAPRHRVLPLDLGLLQFASGPFLSRNIALPRAWRLIQKEVAVAGGRLGVLINGDDDRLHMLIAPAFSRCEAARFALLEKGGSNLK